MGNLASASGNDSLALDLNEDLSPSDEGKKNLTLRSPEVRLRKTVNHDNRLIQ
jgi:hypothetical protein